MWTWVLGFLRESNRRPRLKVSRFDEFFVLQLTGLWSAAKTFFWRFGKSALQEGHLTHNLDRLCLKNTRHQSYWVGHNLGATFCGSPKKKKQWRLDRWNLLARAYRPVHQHCRLFVPDFGGKKNPLCAKQGCRCRLSTSRLDGGSAIESRSR